MQNEHAVPLVQKVNVEVSARGNKIKRFAFKNMLLVIKCNKSNDDK